MRLVQPSSPALTEGTLLSLVRRYGVGEPLSCEPVSQGLLNRGYRLSTTHGSYFLKHHLDGDPADPAGLDRIEGQHRATAQLGALGLPVVPTLACPGGRTVAVVGGRCYALHPWVEGSHRHGTELSAAQSRQLGALLGQVHTRLTQVIPEVPSTAHESADPAATYEVIGELLVHVRARRRRDSFDELAEHRLTERRELLRRYAADRPPAVPDSFSGWVHGDFHPLNLLYATAGREPRPVAILDWDRLGVHPRAEEAVRGAAIFFVRPDGTLDLRKVRGFARAYRHFAGAPRAELAAAVHRVWWERLNDFWMLRWRYQLRDVRADPQFPAAAALVVWWSACYEAVRSAFCD
ncbi:MULTISPECIES: phosphotransferase [unclassified Streptomyces]|uniref:phosphotransferase n=1 Tax=unclassified Streptomyces TaxID=2593676 RepID=UPI002E13C75A|nr:phosphotransferase [Streptomyces sp. NBC_01186]WSS42630.1 phosphotransferase [Streptomyces sp. NBC_01187]